MRLVISINLLIIAVAWWHQPVTRMQPSPLEVRQARLTVEIDPALRGRPLRSNILRIPIESPEPFLAVGLRWKTGAHNSQDGMISLRGSSDATAWTDWISVRRDADLGEPDNIRAGGLILLDRETRYVQFAIDYAGERGGEIEWIEASFISPGATSPDMKRNIIELSKRKPDDEVLQMTTTYPKPAVVTRTEWGCPDGQITTHGSLSYTSVTHLIVHHTVNDNNSTDWPAVVRSIWNFHVFDRGYADIGYNYLVDPNGVIYEGRAGGDNVQGAHFSGVNSGTMGVAMLGEFTAIEPATASLTSLRKILAWKSDQRGIDPNGASLHAASGLLLKNISGHRDGPSATECPGNALYAILPQVRTEIGAILNNVGPVAAVSAASYRATAVAPDSIAAAFGSELAGSVQVATAVPLPTDLSGTTVRLRDSLGTVRLCGLFFVSPGQINLLIPAATATGQADLQIINADGKISNGQVNVTQVAPGLFSANADGKGISAAVVLRVKADGSQTFEPVAQFDSSLNRFVARPIDTGPDSDQIFLVVFGTGIRGRSSLGAVSASLGGSPAEVLYAGPAPDFSGLDQINLRLSRSLAGRGLIDLGISIDGQFANIVQIDVK